MMHQRLGSRFDDRAWCRDRIDDIFVFVVLFGRIERSVRSRNDNAFPNILFSRLRIAPPPIASGSEHVIDLIGLAVKHLVGLSCDRFEHNPTTDSDQASPEDGKEDSFHAPLREL